MLEIFAQAWAHMVASTHTIRSTLNEASDGTFMLYISALVGALFLLMWQVFKQRLRLRAQSRELSQREIELESLKTTLERERHWRMVALNKGDISGEIASQKSA